ncbi:MAG TPA: hypothetical protein VGS02_10140 [Acidobacteriaceae bacterium]|nr:hypothetical protein [Acidobacteriaceae bacterium]
MQNVAHKIPPSFPKSEFRPQLVAKVAADCRPSDGDDWIKTYLRLQEQFLLEEIASGEGDSWLQDIT